MTDELTAARWAATRGEKWLAQASGMEAMLQPVDAPLLEALRLDAPYRIADLGCGGGATAAAIARAAAPGSTVTGFDISPALVEHARIRHGDAAEFAVADLATAPAPTEPYQRLASRFGVMFFSEPAAAFARLTTWLEAGGRFAFAVWGSPAGNPWFTTVEEVVARFVTLPRMDDPSMAGPFRYADAGEFVALLDQAGFREIEVRHWQGEIAIGGGLRAPEAARFALAGFSSFGERLAEAGGEAQEQALAALEKRYAEGVTFGAHVQILTGAV